MEFKDLDISAPCSGYYRTLVKANCSYDEMLNIYIMNVLGCVNQDNSSIIDCKSIISRNVNQNDESTIRANKILKKIPIEGIEFLYKDKKCFAKQLLKSQYMGYKDNNQIVDLLYDLVIYIKNGDEAAFDNLLKDSNIWWVKNIQNDEKKEELVTCKFWDSWAWDVLYKQPKRNFMSIYFEDDFLNSITETLDSFFKPETKELYRRLGITYKKSFLFEGPPGTGKTSLIYSIASKYSLDIAYLQITNKLETTALILAMRRIPKKSILVIEDIDSVFNKRDKTEITMEINFSTLLNIIDGILKPQDSILIIFTSNFKDKLDGALKRPGRIDEIVNFGYSTKNQIRKMYQNYFLSASEEDFNLFYKSIKNIKNLTICVLQKIFLKFIDNFKDLPKKTNEIIDSIEECKLYNDVCLNLYN